MHASGGELTCSGCFVAFVARWDVGSVLRNICRLTMFSIEHCVLYASYAVGPLIGLCITALS
jgi:hypothetical protein